MQKGLQAKSCYGNPSFGGFFTGKIDQNGWEYKNHYQQAEYYPAAGQYPQFPKSSEVGDSNGVKSRRRGDATNNKPHACLLKSCLQAMRNVQPYFLMPEITVDDVDSKVNAQAYQHTGENEGENIEVVKGDSSKPERPDDADGQRDAHVKKNS